MAKQTSTPVEQLSGNYPKLVDKRLQQVRFSLEEQKADAIVVNYIPNIRYLTNYSGSEATLFIKQNEIHFVTDDRYEEQIKEELYDLPNLFTHVTRDVWSYAIDSDIFTDVETLAFEADRIAYSEAVDIRNQIRPLKFKPAPMIVEPFTIPKAPEELEKIQKSCDISVKVYEKILEYIKPGISEIDIAIEMSYLARKFGSEGDPFDFIVTSGSRGALVHGHPTDKKIKLGDIIILDFGCKVGGFCSDITRTIAVGKATKEQHNIYNLLNNAKEEAIRDVRPGINGKILDKISRTMIEKQGYGKYFQHSLGHGLGLSVHEMPIITFRKDDQIVPADSVLAIEPGIYIPEKFGMRIEDNIFVTVGGAKHLTKAPSELLVI